jgi:hypothetical protein
MSWKKILVGAGIGGGLIAGVSYFLRLRRTSVELETVTTVIVHKLDLKGISLRVDATLKNPTKSKLSIKFPFVRLVQNDTVIGSSQVIDQNIEIPPFGEARVEKIMIQVPLSGIFSIGAALAKSLQSGEAVKLLVKILTTIDLGWKQLPYEKTDEVTLRK